MCDTCAPGLKRVSETFHALKHQGGELKKRRNRLPHPKLPERDHYRNIKAQKEWLRPNVFDTMGNYLFCHSCIVKALRVSHQRLARQRRIKQKLFQKPVQSMSKQQVESEKLTGFVVMPEGIESNFKQWWKSVPDDHSVQKWRRNRLS